MQLGEVPVDDRRAVLERGQVLQIGTHTALLARGGGYADLLASQLAEASAPG